MLVFNSLKSLKAISSLKIVFVPKRFPAGIISANGIPINHAIGANIRAAILCRDIGSPYTLGNIANKKSARATKLKKTIREAITDKNIFNPSFVPTLIASIELSYIFKSSLTVFNSVWAEGINILENIIAAGTDKIEAVKKWPMTPENLLSNQVMYRTITLPAMVDLSLIHI